MIYEMRIYEAQPGKLPALNARFANATLRLFARHGIVAVGFWTTYIGPSANTLTYILAWDDLRRAAATLGCLPGRPRVAGSQGRVGARWPAACASAKHHHEADRVFADAITAPYAHCGVFFRPGRAKKDPRD